MPNTLSTTIQRSAPKLSICISTLNRAHFIGATLESILPQLTDDCELLVLDNASSDDTQKVVLSYAEHTDHLRYVRKESDDGFDRNFDHAVEIAQSEYCWLMSDDDLLKPAAVESVLKILHQDPGMVFVNAEFRDFSMAEILQSRLASIDSDRAYGPWELDRVFMELDDLIRYIGAIVIKRSIWLARDRQLYFGSCYGFVGVIFQSRFPRPIHLIAEPMVSYRTGNRQAFPSQGVELWLAKWPSLVESLPISKSAKRKHCSAAPWRHVLELLYRRGVGIYSLTGYRRWIRPQLCVSRHKLLPAIVAVLPRALVNTLLVLYLRRRRACDRRWLEGFWLGNLRASRFYFGNWRIFGRGRSHPAAMNVGTAAGT